jgi:glycosyltransferase involved in cell wall biosynthesis
MKTSKPLPLISIVIPCYNEARFIGKVLESLNRQKYDGDYEVIIVDNNCSDNTAAIALAYGARVISENNPGVCFARQTGTEAAKGEIVISTDADTTFNETWLSDIMASFAKSEDCVAVAGPCVFSDGPWWGKVYPSLLFGSVSLFNRVAGRPFYITATNLAFKKSAWRQYNTALTQGGDELALLHDLEKKGSVVFDNKNPVYTSGRRLEKGLFYNFFISFLVYYLLAYYLNRLFNRPVLGTAPAFRTPVSAASRRLALVYRSLVVVGVITLLHLPGHDTMLQQVDETYAVVKNVIQEIV